jgi:hypothetical protein
VIVVVAAFAVLINNKVASRVIASIIISREMKERASLSAKASASHGSGELFLQSIIRLVLEEAEVTRRNNAFHLGVLI